MEKKGRRATRVLVLAVLLLPLGGGMFLENGAPGRSGSLGATSVLLKAKKKPKKKERAPKKPKPCCKLGIAYRSGSGLVVLEQICKQSTATVVHLRTVNLNRVCTYPPATFIIDGRGRRYPMLAHSGLPNCANGTNRVRNVRFTWVFKPLRPGVKRVTVIEVNAQATAGYAYWAWRNVDISRCGN